MAATSEKSAVEYIRSPETRRRISLAGEFAIGALSALAGVAGRLRPLLSRSLKTLAKPEIARPLVSIVAIAAAAIWLDYVLWIYPQIRAEQYLNTGGSETAARAIELENRTRIVNSAILGGFLMLGLLAWRLIRRGGIADGVGTTTADIDRRGNIVPIAAVQSLERIACLIGVRNRVETHADTGSNAAPRSAAFSDKGDCPVVEYFGWERATHTSENGGN